MTAINNIKAKQKKKKSPKLLLNPTLSSEPRCSHSSYYEFQMVHIFQMSRMHFRDFKLLLKAQGHRTNEYQGCT
jgi:hypothetical protein